MSDEGDTFWVNLAEKFLGLIVLIVGGVMLYLTATSLNQLSVFSSLFGALSVVVILIGLFLLLVRAPE